MTHNHNVRWHTVGNWEKVKREQHINFKISYPIIYYLDTN